MPAGGFHVTNRQGGQKTLMPGANQGSTALAQPFIYEVAQVENVIFNEQSTTPSISQQSQTRADETAGRIQFRSLSIDQQTKRKDLNWADPLNPYQSVFPIIGEHVLVFKALGRYYYMGPLNTQRNITQNRSPLLGDTVEAAGSTLQRARESLAGVTKTILNAGNTNKSKFKDINVNPLKVYEGDIILQGRYGNSIRFGSSQRTGPATEQNPNIIIRAGQAKSAPKTGKEKLALTIEHVDDDASTIYLSSDETIAFTPATLRSSAFLASVKNRPGAFDGAQILINSDRVTLNAKDTSIFLFANEGIYLNSTTEGITLDSEGSIIVRSLSDTTIAAKSTVFLKSEADIAITAKQYLTMDADKRITLRGNEIYIGGYSNFAEPLVLGTTLKLFLLQLKELFKVAQPLTIPLTGLASPVFLGLLELLYAQYRIVPGVVQPLWASNDNFALKSNVLTAGATVKV
jgi:hypothetical protein